MHIAIASKHNIAIDEHFGHAKKFYIYQIINKKPAFIEERPVKNYCLGGSSDKAAMADILETISDCKAVFVARIGDGPLEKLQARGIAAITDYPWETIDSALKDYITREGEYE